MGSMMPDLYQIRGARGLSDNRGMHGVHNPMTCADGIAPSKGAIVTRLLYTARKDQSAEAQVNSSGNQVAGHTAVTATTFDFNSTCEGGRC